MKIQHLLARYFGHTSFRGPQKEIVTHVLAGGHALVIMPTGMGKSVCYQIPALVRDDLTLVISPLVALMQDQVDSLQRKGIDAVFINSSLTAEQRNKRYSEVREGRFRLLYVTPERFRKQEFIDCLESRQVGLLAVDEAHCISTWGHDFRPDYTRLKAIRNRLHNPVTIALTATATPEVATDIITQLGLEGHQIKIFHEGIERPNLRLAVEEVWGEEDKLKHIAALRQKHPGNAIVYFSLIKTMEQFSENLRELKVPHLCYHGKMEPQQRRKVQHDFMTGSDKLILATNAFGMGIDKEDIRLVIHAEVPGSLESYYQEIGRAGRDGRDSFCVLLYDQQDLLIHMDFIKWNNPDAEFYRRFYSLLLDKLEQFQVLGLEALKEELHFKSTRDYRLETGLRMLERYGAIDGNLEQHNLTICGDLPARLTDNDYLREKQLREQQKLYAMVQYAKNDQCRKHAIHTYFGLPAPEHCSACDSCG